MTLGRLKWLAIAAPICVLAVIWALLHTVVDLRGYPGVLVVLVTTVVL